MKTHLQWTVAAMAAVLLSGMMFGTTASADGPDRVLRMFAFRQGPDPCPDWEGEDSLGLLVHPPQGEAGEIVLAQGQNCDLVAAILAQNGIDDEGVQAVLCATVFSGTTWTLGDAAHFTTDGIRRVRLYWLDGAPPGAATRTGPGEDVIILGAFPSFKITSARTGGLCELDGTCGQWMIAGPADPADELICVAMGWFTK